MYDPSKNLPLLASLLAKGVVTVAVGTAAAPAVAGGAIAFSAVEIAKAFAPDVTEHMLSALDYARFREFLLKTHPGDLNHDLDKLIKDALRRAVGFIRRLYIDKLKQENELTFWENFNNPFAEIDEVLAAMERDLNAKLNAETFQKEELERYLTGNHADCFEEFAGYLFGVSGVDETDAEWQKLRLFFQGQLPSLFDLAYKEALKDEKNVKAFRTFEIWILEEGLRNQTHLLAGQKQIRADIKALRDGLSPAGHTRALQQLEADSQRIPAMFTKKLDSIIAQLRRIERKIDGVKKDTEEIKGMLRDGHSHKVPRQLTNIPAFGGDFFGREEDVERVHKALRESRKVVLMNGTGGVGKTTLAKWFVRENLTHYDHICWIDVTKQDAAVDGKLITGSIKEVMADNALLFTNLNGPYNPQEDNNDQRFARITNALRNLAGRNLLVIDNAGSDAGEKAIRNQFPQPPDWQVLITSRMMLPGYEVVPLDTISPDAAETLFYAHYTFDCPAAEVKALLESIGYHTLTVELFAKTLEAHHGRLSVGDLLGKVQRKTLDDADLQRRIETEHHPDETAVFLHLMLAFDCTELMAEEKSVLRQLALLPPEPYILNGQLAPWLGYRDPAQARVLDQAIEQLVKKGWLTQAKHTYSLHRLLQQVIMYQLPFYWEATKTLINSITGALETVDNPNALAVYPLRKYGEFLLAGVPLQYQDTPEITHLKNNVALVYQGLGRYDEAAVLLEEALQSNLISFGPSDPTVAVSKANLAAVYQSLYRYQDAAILLEDALLINLTSFGPNHPMVDRSQSNLAMVYKGLGHYQDAAGLLETALKSNQTNFVPNHPNVAVSQANLASVYQNLGRYQEAADLLEVAIRSAKAHFGPNHPALAGRQSSLATVYQKMGRYEDAAGLLQVVLEIDQTNFRSDHPTVAVSQWNLAMILIDMEQLEAAFPLLQKAEKTFVLRLGEAHPYTKSVRGMIDSIQRRL